MYKSFHNLPCSNSEEVDIQMYIERDLRGNLTGIFELADTPELYTRYQR